MPPLSSIDWSGFHDWLERWAPLAEWGVVLGTLGLAAATVWLASRTNKAAEAQGAAALRAHVYPETTAQWAWGTEGGASGLGQRVLPLRNGGPGVAINVEGQVRRGTEGERIALYAGSIAPGHIINARPAVQIEGGWGAWAGTWHGELHYGDLNGDRWTTRFTIAQGEGNQIVVEHESPAQVEDSKDHT
jgi:hypothetical protein